MMPRPQFSLKTLLWLTLVVAAFCAGSTADDATDNAITKDRKKMEGTWRIVTLISGGEKPNDEFKKVDLLVAFEADGKWTLTLDGEKVSTGTTTINPTTTRREIDIKAADGTQYLGIYEFTDKAHRICFASPEHPRPTEFSSKHDSDQILMVFERKEHLGCRPGTQE